MVSASAGCFRDGYLSFFCLGFDLFGEWLECALRLFLTENWRVDACSWGWGVRGRVIGGISRDVGVCRLLVVEIMATPFSLVTFGFGSPLVRIGSAVPFSVLASSPLAWGLLGSLRSSPAVQTAPFSGAVTNSYVRLWSATSSFVGRPVPRGQGFT